MLSANIKSHLMSVTLLLIGILFYLNCNACRCPKEERDSTVHKAILNSDLIFTGELISCEYDEPWVKAYQFKIIELFKGECRRDTMNGCITGMCSVIPREPGLWIVYASLINDSTIEINNCSPTISLTRTNIIIPSPSIFPEFEDQTSDSLKVKIYNLERKIDGLNDWLSDLEKLRKYKREHNMTIETRNEKRQLYLIAFLVLMNLVLLTIVFIKKRKKDTGKRQVVQRHRTGHINF